MITKNCFFCGKEFTSENWKGYEPIYCSTKCYHDYKKTKFIDVVCEFCGKEFSTYLYRKDTVKFCSHSCTAKYVSSIRRKNAKPVKRSNYWFIMNHEYHRADKQGYAKIADMTAEKKIGRLLLENELVHHIDGNKLNDSPDNLEVITYSKHSSLESNIRWSKEKIFVWSCLFEKCIDCGTTAVRHWAKGRCKNCYKKYNKLKNKNL